MLDDFLVGARNCANEALFASDWMQLHLFYDFLGTSGLFGVMLLSWRNIFPWKEKLIFLILFYLFPNVTPMIYIKD